MFSPFDLIIHLKLSLCGLEFARFCHQIGLLSCLVLLGWQGCHWWSSCWTLLVHVIHSSLILQTYQFAFKSSLWFSQNHHLIAGSLKLKLPSHSAMYEWCQIVFRSDLLLFCFCHIFNLNLKFCPVSLLFLSWYLFEVDWSDFQCIDLISW